jgi:hypothetical protein
MAALPWISPAAADDMLFDDPLGSSPDFGFALMRPKAKGKRNTTADLARAKLQPSKPDDAAWGPDGLWPITCTTSRLVPAPGVAIEPDALEAVFAGYDARVKPHQKLLATVLTMRFGHDRQQLNAPADRTVPPRRYVAQSTHRSADRVPNPDRAVFLAARTMAPGTGELCPQYRHWQNLHHRRT